MATVTQHGSMPNVGEQTRHRIARRLLPFLFILYVANYIDRTSVAYATLEMSRELGFSDRVFATGAGIFFIGYLGLQIPGALLVERWSARRWLAMIMIVWGSLTGLTAAVHSANQLYVARFLLGVAEAGFFPGVIVYLTHWFVYEDRAKAVANFMGALPISFVIGSPIAGALLGVHWLGIEGWRWLFILEGLPAVLLGIATLFLLTDRPREAQWLAAEQQQWITSRLDQERHAKSAVQSYTVWQALRYPPVLLLATSLLFAYIAFYSFVFWLPTMLKRMAAMSDLRVGVVGAIPYLAGFIGMQVIGWSSDHFRERRWHFVATQLLGAAALIVLLLAPMSVPTAVVCFTLVGVSVSAMLPCFWALPSAFLSDSAAAASIGFINAFASLGGFIGPEAIAHLHTRTGSFSAGLGFMAVSFVIAAVVVLFCPRERVG